MQCVGSAEESIERLPAGVEGSLQRRGAHLPPYGSGVHLVIRQVYLAVADVFVAVVPYLLVAGNSAHQMHFTAAARASRSVCTVCPFFFFKAVQYLQFRKVDRVSVII